MAALRLARRALLYGLLLGSISFAAPPAGAGGGRFDEHASYEPDARLQYVRWGLFCDWHSRHPLCREVNAMPLLCDQQPDQGLCEDEDGDRFCENRPDHPLCGDDRFCEKSPNHPLCDNDQPPSRS